MGLSLVQFQSHIFKFGPIFWARFSGPQHMVFLTLNVHQNMLLLVQFHVGCQLFFIGTLHQYYYSPL